MFRKTSVEVIVILLILLFAYTAISKMADTNAFGKQLYNQPLPYWFTAPFVWIIPIAELITAALLLMSTTRFYGLLLSVILMVLFTSYVALITFGFFSRIPCSCGGVISSLSWAQHLVFNFIFLLLSIAGLAWHQQNTTSRDRATR